MGVAMVRSPLGRTSAPISTLVPEETARVLLRRLVTIQAKCDHSPAQTHNGVTISVMRVWWQVRDGYRETKPDAGHRRSKDALDAMRLAIVTLAWS